MARYAQNAVEDVRARADIVDVIGAHVRLRRAGRNFTGLCPFHEEKTPSFSVSAERGFFHCFGCGVGGSVFDFVMRVEGLTFPEALQSLARRYGITLPQADGEPASIGKNERDALIQANQLAADFYAHVLWKTSEGGGARDYLKSRGINVDTAQNWLLGFAPARPANLAAALEKRGLTEAGVKLGLLKTDRGAPYDMFRARLMFPIRDAQGRVIAFGGRVLDDRLPKYINSPESQLYSKARMVYGLYEARQAIGKADRAIIVEGYLDTIALWQAGFAETVASLGTALTPDQLRLLGRFTRNLIACFDGDNAGQKASMRALEVFLEAGLLGRGAFIPSGFDPDSFVKARGAEALREIVDKAELLADYFLRNQASAASGAADEKARAAERVAGILAKIKNPFEFDLMARKAAGMLGIDEKLLRTEARKGSSAARRPGPAGPTPGPRTMLAVAEQAELGLLAIALRWPQMRTVIASSLAEGPAESIGAVLLNFCRSDESGGALEVAAMERIGETGRSHLSALMLDPMLDDEAKAGGLLADYLGAIAAADRRVQMAQFLRAARQSNGDEATAQAQALISLRRDNGGR
jgi:DNA primase